MHPGRFAVRGLAHDEHRFVALAFAHAHDVGAESKRRLIDREGERRLEDEALKVEREERVAMDRGAIERGQERAHEREVPTFGRVEEQRAAEQERARVEAVARVDAGALDRDHVRAARQHAPARVVTEVRDERADVPRRVHDPGRVRVVDDLERERRVDRRERVRTRARHVEGRVGNGSDAHVEPRAAHPSVVDLEVHHAHQAPQRAPLSGGAEVRLACVAVLDVGELVAERREQLDDRHADVGVRLVRPLRMPLSEEVEHRAA